jgi:hypothetical protein
MAVKGFIGFATGHDRKYNTRQRGHVPTNTLAYLSGMSLKKKKNLFNNFDIRLASFKGRGEWPTPCMRPSSMPT